MRFVAIALAGWWAASSPALAKPKTMKAYQTEWRADKADNQAKGVTQKAYVDQCRSGSPTTSPAATPDAAKLAPAVAAPAPTLAVPPPNNPATKAPLGIKYDSF
jgi:hypothetical protein